jgi:Mor family transcriptional regulator
MSETRVPPLPQPYANHRNKRRFTDEEVWEIRREFSEGTKKPELMRKYDVSRPCLNDVLHGKHTYKDV